MKIYPFTTHYDFCQILKTKPCRTIVEFLEHCCMQIYLNIMVHCVWWTVFFYWFITFYLSVLASYLSELITVQLAFLLLKHTYWWWYNMCSDSIFIYPLSCITWMNLTEEIVSVSIALFNTLYRVFPKNWYHFMI